MRLIKLQKSKVVSNMAIVWDQKNISIVVIPEQNLFDSLKPIMHEWTEEGLLGRFLLVGPESLHEDENESLVITSLSWGNGDQGFGFYKSNLFEVIAQYEFDVVRVVSLRSLEKSSKLSKEQNLLLEKVATAVSRALPMANARLNEMQQVTRLLKLNLLVSPSKVANQDYSMAFVENWDMHVVASPEDRSTPWTADALVRGMSDMRDLR